MNRQFIGTFYDKRRSLRRLLARADPVLIDGVLNFLELLQCIQIRSLPLFLQLFTAYVRIAGETPGCLGNL